MSSSSFAFWVSATVGDGLRGVALGDAAGADHLHMLVHEAAGAGGIAYLDEPRKLAMRLQHMRRDGAIERRIAARPRDVLQRLELDREHAVMRGLGDGQVKRGAVLREGRHVVEEVRRLVVERLEPREIGGGGKLS